jgi:prepilin-type N-terminal cleavage/methylation domain-containing protein
MNERVRRAREDQGGFTLIELMIVIIILGVLSGIVIFSVRGITDRGNVSACKTDLSSITTAVEAYRTQTGSFPTHLVPQLTSGSTVFLRWDTGFTGTTTATGPAPATSDVHTGGGSTGAWTITYYPVADPAVPAVQGDVIATGC